MRSDLQVPRLLWSTLAFLIVGGPGILGASDPSPALDRQKWLRTETAQVLISAHPSLRISELSEAGGSTLLPGPAEGFQSDVRLIALEKKDGSQTYIPFDQPARWISYDERSAVLETSATENGRSFKLTISLTLSEKKGSLDVRCTLLPGQPSSKPLALWAIASLAPRGWVVTTLSRGFEKQQMIPGHLVTYWKTPLNAPSLRLDDDILAVDLSQWQQDLKYGTRSNAGWIAAIDPERQTMLTATFPYEAGAAYPDGNCNATIYLGLHASGGRYAEMEWLSPWTNVPAGQELTWLFSLESRTFPSETLPISPQKLKEALLRPVKIEPAKILDGDSHHWTLSAQSPQTRDYFGRVTEWFGGSSTHGKALASAPYWKNAPVWSDTTASLQWDTDTFIETNPNTLLPWSEKNRIWQIEFSPTKAEVAEKHILFLDGDPQAGVCLFVAQDQVSAVAWDASSQQILCAKLTASTDADAKHSIRLELSPSKKTLTLKVNDGHAHQTSVPFTVRPKAANLVIGRPALLPSTPTLADLQPFVGRISLVSVSQPALP